MPATKQKVSANTTQLNKEKVLANNSTVVPFTGTLESLPGSPSMARKTAPLVNRAISIDADRLIVLRKNKILADWQFVLFALEYSYGISETYKELLNRVSFDALQFCVSWDLEEQAFWTAIAQLNKKDIWRCNTRQLELQFTFIPKEEELLESEKVAY